VARYEASLQRDLDRTERLLQTIKLEAPWPMREERREHGRPIPPPPKVVSTQPPSLAALASPPAKRGEIKRGAPRPDSLSGGTAKRGEPNRTKPESTKPPSLAARAAPPNAKRWGEIQRGEIKRGELSPEQLAKVEAWPPERLAEAMAARLRAAQPSPDTSRRAALSTIREAMVIPEERWPPPYWALLQRGLGYSLVTLAYFEGDRTQANEGIAALERAYHLSVSLNDTETAEAVAEDIASLRRYYAPRR